MKNKVVLSLTRILCILFLLGTIVSLLIVYKDLDSSIAFKFVTGYLFFTFFMLLYLPFIAVFNLRKFKWAEIRKRVLRFIALVLLFGILNYGFNYFRSSNINYYSVFSTALGLSFGMVFIDVIFLNKEQ